MANWLSFVNPRKYKQGNKIQEVLLNIMQGLIDSPEETLAALEEAGEEGKKYLEQIAQLAKAAEGGEQNPLAQKALQAMTAVSEVLQSSDVEAKQDYLSSLKCGGKVKKKEVGGAVKKACGGKRLQNGNKLKPKAKCGCSLKREGGKLIEISDCDNTIVLPKLNFPTKKQLQKPETFNKHSWLHKFDK